MLAYVVLKTVHVTCAFLFLGTGLGSAFYKYRADRSDDLRVVAWCQRQVVLADWLFTVPSGVLLPITGGALVWVSGLSWTAPWIVAGFIGYAIAGVCWLPAAYFQLQMRKMAEAALRDGTELPARFHAQARAWTWLGIPSFLAAAITVVMMVSKGAYILTW